MDLYAEVVDTPTEVVDGDTTVVEEMGTVIVAPTETADNRLKRRAKRPSKYLMRSIKDVTVPLASSNGQLKAGKNLRRPRNGYGRGLAKKGKSFTAVSVHIFFYLF